MHLPQLVRFQGSSKMYQEVDILNTRLLGHSPPPPNLFSGNNFSLKSFGTGKRVEKLKFSRFWFKLVAFQY